ncbi:triose-phosphate isomerase [Robbsia andropogonis]|nr:triose-phosphate isomerase [Robbsia andropogonis]
MSEQVKSPQTSVGHAHAHPADAGRTRWVVGNWKMHGSLASNATLLSALADTVGRQPAAEAGVAGGVKVGVCVPFCYLSQAQQALSGSAVRLGVQDISGHALDKGAYTGEISAAMVREFDVTLVIVGHSERRTLLRESDAAVVAKTRQVLDGGMTPVVCVGETLAEREAGRTEAVVGAQLDALLSAFDAGQLRRMVFAYEPVWAIGTGKSATAQQAQDVHAFLRARLVAKNEVLEQVALLYGGSVKPGNAAELFGQPDIDGGLIGGAALVADDFIAICRAA